MAYIVSVKNRQSGEQYFLRSSIWTTSRDRADTFETDFGAKTAIAKAMTFTKPRVFAQRYTAPEIIEA